MKVLFLDVDGVMINTPLFEAGRFETLGEEFLDRLQRIINQTNAKIVLSSSWRLEEQSYAKVERALATRNLKLEDRTVELNRFRSHEIQEWLGRHPQIVKFAVLDDWNEAGYDIEHSFFQTKMDDGLTEEIAERVIKHLNG